MSVSSDDSLPQRECELECPLRKPHNYMRDPPLPQALDSAPLTRAEASARLYTPIKEWQTRLLRLHSGEYGTSISADLSVVDITHLSGAVLHEQQQRTQYTALSYTWDAPAFPRTIVLQGVECPITENLHAFLPRHRTLFDRQYLWIDALCINQLDLEEKAKQVSHMLTIFERAYSVAVWLGEEGPNTKLTIDYLRSTNTHTGHSDECYHSVSRLMSGIEDLCSRPWLLRMWIRQEVWVAKRLLVFCGSSKMTWSQYVHAPSVTIASTRRRTLTCVSQSDPRSHQIMPKISENHLMCLRNLRSPRMTMPQIPGAGESNEPHDILRLLNESIFCQTSIPHDRVYALLGIAGIQPIEDADGQSASKVSIDVDYSISLAQLYSRLAMSMIVCLGAYSILITDGTFGPQQGLDLPSWTPDFRKTTSCKLRWDSAAALLPEAGLQRMRELNPDITSSTFHLEGWLSATIIEPIPPHLDMDAFPVTLAPWQKSYTKAMDDYRFLKSMIVVDGEVFMHRTLQFTSASTLPIPSVHGGVMAFSKEPQRGDVLIFAHTIPVPLILRPIASKRDHFTFVSCALWYKFGGARTYDPDVEGSWKHHWMVPTELYSFGSSTVVDPKRLMRRQIFHID